MGGWMWKDEGGYRATPTQNYVQWRGVSTREHLGPAGSRGSGDADGSSMRVGLRQRGAIERALLARD
eukprot:scaffold99138_cov30-Tisochrysis_lutea.AAC.6